LRVSRTIPADNDRVTVIDASVGYMITSLPAQNVYELGFSPLGTFIITWQRPSKDEDGDAVKNLKVWRVVEEGGPNAGEGEQNVVGRFVQKSQTGWNLLYTYDERYCARVVTNEVQFYQSHDLRVVWNKLRVEGVVDFAVSPGKNHSIAVFVPERKVWPLFCPCYILNTDRLKGPPCCREDFQCAKLRSSGVPKELFQGGQSPAKVEFRRHESGCASSNRGG